MSVEQIAAEVAHASGLTKGAVTPVIRATLNVLAERIRRGERTRTEWFNFGTRTLPERGNFNLATQAHQIVPPKRVPNITATEALKRMVAESEVES